MKYDCINDQIELFQKLFIILSFVKPIVKIHFFLEPCNIAENSVGFVLNIV